VNDSVRSGAVSLASSSNGFETPRAAVTPFPSRHFLSTGD
jgi:hypothetical protein